MFETVWESCEIVQSPQRLSRLSRLSASVASAHQRLSRPMRFSLLSRLSRRSCLNLLSASGATESCSAFRHTVFGHRAALESPVQAPWGFIGQPVQQVIVRLGFIFGC